VPERKDDLAWENDKVAFRIYGPALRPGPEDSGIDLWTKRVTSPVIVKWYEDELKNGRSYHKDHGEGLDAFKVGDTRGCGGTALWIDGKTVTPDTYLSAEIIWTSPDVAEFHTTYRYPVKLQGKPLFEYRVTRLRMGERLCEVTSTFSNHPNKRFRNQKTGTAIPQEVVIGLTAQSKDASISLDAAKGIAAIHGPFSGSTLGTGIVVNPATVIRTEQVPASGKDSPGNQAMLVVRPDEESRVQYRTGFAWAADGEITSEKAWLDYLASETP
jgi:hypothetical protein